MENALDKWELNDEDEQPKKDKHGGMRSKNSRTEFHHCQSSERGGL